MSLDKPHLYSGMDIRHTWQLIGKPTLQAFIIPNPKISSIIDDYIEDKRLTQKKFSK